MTTRYAKFEGLFNLPSSVDRLIYVTDASGGSGSFTVPAADYYVSDLIEYIETQLNLITTATCSWSISATTGRVVVSTDSALEYEIEFNDNILPVDYLGFFGTIIYPTTTPTTGEKHPEGLVNLTAPTVKDLPRTDSIKSTSIADDGTTQTIELAQIQKRELTIAYEGYPRRDTWGEMQQIDDFYTNYLLPAKSYRYYPDKTVTTSYTRTSNPWGYHTCITNNITRWKPVVQRPGWYGRFKNSLIAQIQ